MGSCISAQQEFTSQQKSPIKQKNISISFVKYEKSLDTLSYSEQLAKKREQSLRNINS